MPTRSALEMILQIYREPLKPGSEDAYRAIEEDTARVCANLKCPHPHLAMESLTGPREVWWLETLTIRTSEVGQCWWEVGP